MRVHVLSAYESEEDRYGATWIRSLGDGKSAKFSSAEEADVILFVEKHPGHDPYFFDVYNHELRRKYPHKSVLFHDADCSVTLMPTIAPSVEQWQMGCGFLRPFHYFYARVCENYAVQKYELYSPTFKPQLLASFVGTSVTHPTRPRVLNLASSSDIYCHDTLDARAWQMTPTEKVAYEQRFVETMIDSHFILCPRGRNPSTYRLYESMQLGRVPVIIADEWVAPNGPDWEKCSIRVPESNVFEIPQMLRGRVSEAAEMGLAAREAWEQFFSPQVTLDRLACAAMDLITSPKPAFARLRAASQYLQRGNARKLAGWSGRRMIAKFRTVLGS